MNSAGEWRGGLPGCPAAYTEDGRHLKREWRLLGGHRCRRQVISTIPRVRLVLVPIWVLYLPGSVTGASEILEIACRLV